MFELARAGTEADLDTGAIDGTRIENCSFLWLTVYLIWAQFTKSSYCAAAHSSRSCYLSCIVRVHKTSELIIIDRIDCDLAGDYGNNAWTVVPLYLHGVVSLGSH